MTPRDFIQGFILSHEGGSSLDPLDSGNEHHGQLVGSKYGVTGDVLAKYRNVPFVTASQMAALTLDEAVQIGLKLFYATPHFDLLPWNQVTASVVDMGWGAGPGQAIKLLQRMIGANDDGQLGPYTARAYREYLAHVALETAAQRWADVRLAFYEQTIVKRPSNARYRNGWRNRTNSFLPGGPWWAEWSIAA